MSNVVLQLPNGRRLFAIPKFQLAGGAHLLLHGASGTGKSTLLHLLAGLMLPNEGDVYYGDKSFSLMGDHARSQIRRENIGLIFQKLNLLTHLTAAENVSLAVSRKSPTTKRDISGEIDSALKRVRMSEFASIRTSNLSGGEQQRVAVARVLAQNPQIILADEPTSSLDDDNAEFIIDELKTAAKGKTLLVVSHDDRLKSKFSERRSLQELIDGRAT